MIAGLEKDLKFFACATSLAFFDEDFYSQHRI
jgi:hypothetical protein